MTVASQFTWDGLSAREAAAQRDQALVAGGLGCMQRRQVGPVRVLVGPGLVVQGIEIEAIHVEQMAEQGPERAEERQEEGRSRAGHRHRA